MNVPFQMSSPELDSVFLKEAEAQGLVALKGPVYQVVCVLQFITQCHWKVFKH